jgi:hypothetical protein
MEYAIHTHYFFEISTGISNQLHELEINSYFNFDFFFQIEIFLLSFLIF